MTTLTIFTIPTTTICMYIYIYIYIHTYFSLCTYVCMYVCMYMYVCMHIYIYIYIHIHRYICLYLLAVADVRRALVLVEVRGREGPDFFFLLSFGGNPRGHTRVRTTGKFRIRVLLRLTEGPKANPSTLPRGTLIFSV